MAKLFGLDVSGLVAKHIGPGVYDATLTSITKGARGANSTAGQATVETTLLGRGFVDNFAATLVDGTVIRIEDVKVVLLGDSFIVSINPKPGDTVTIQGSTYRVIRLIGRDPASAIFELQCRK